MLSSLAIVTTCCFGVAVLGFILTFIGDAILEKSIVATIGLIMLIAGGFIGLILLGLTKWMFIYELWRSVI